MLVIVAVPARSSHGEAEFNPFLEEGPRTGDEETAGLASLLAAGAADGDEDESDEINPFLVGDGEGGEANGKGVAGGGAPAEGASAGGAPVKAGPPAAEAKATERSATEAPAAKASAAKSGGGTATATEEAPPKTGTTARRREPSDPG